MPTIEISYNDLTSLIGKRIAIEKLQNEAILFAKGEVENRIGDLMKIEIKDTNRPDLWSAEGIAREIRLRHAKGFPEYKIKKSRVVVNVDKSLKNIRPLTVCAVVRNLKLDSNALSQMIQLQEKVSTTFGRNRKEVATGVYDLDKISPPIRFTAVGNEIKFVPLDFEKPMTPEEVLKKHPKGKEFGHLLKGTRYPMFIDSQNQVLSMPPIINSAHTGRVTEGTKNIFIECSGFDSRFLNTALNVMAAALHERGGKIEGVSVNYGDKRITTPDLSPKKCEIETDYINAVTGLNLSKKQIYDLLERSGYRLKVSGKKLKLFYPAYRQDIMHARDVVEDALISYSFNKIGPVVPSIAKTGKSDEMELFCSELSQIMAGLGLQEIISYNLTDKFNIFNKMNLEEEKIAEIENPISVNWSVFRNWLLPSLMEFFSKNKHVEYPQRIFEIGNCILLDEKKETRTSDILKLAAALSDSIVNYEQISSILNSFMRSVGLRYKLKSRSHKSFIDGRCAEIIVDKSIGIVGEIHPQVLNNWKLEKPVVAMEFDLGEIFKTVNEQTRSNIIALQGNNQDIISL